MLVLCAYLKSIAHHACRAFLKQKGINLKKMATTRNLQIDFHLEEFIDTTVPLISSSYKQTIPILAQKTLTEWTYYPAFMKSRSRFS